MDHVLKVAIVLNNVAVKLLLLDTLVDDDQKPAATASAIEAVKTLQTAMELMRLVTAPTSSPPTSSSPPPRAPPPPLLHNGRPIRQGGDAQEHDDANTTTTRIMTTMAAAAIGIPDDHHHDSMMMPIGIVSCIILYNYGLALERVGTAPDAAVHRIFVLAWQLLDEMRTSVVMAEDDDDDDNVLQRSIVVKLTQVSHRIGMTQ
jgi:hypothetical protein